MADRSVSQATKVTNLPIVVCARPMLCGIIAAPVFGTRDEHRHPYQIPSPAVPEIARQRSFAKAADALAVSQPAISKTLKELEEILEASLFERGKSGVSLTAAGGGLHALCAGPCGRRCVMA